MVGRAGFEPATFRLSDGPNKNVINWLGFTEWLKRKSFSAHYQRVIVLHAQKYFNCLFNGDFSSVDGSNCWRDKLSALANLAKFLGCYEDYKLKLKRYGIKWSSGDSAFEGFLSIFNHKHDTLPDYIKEIQPHIKENEQLLVKFLALTGLRAGEGTNAFNLIITLNSKGKLDTYYTKEMNVLEHFKFKQIFLRGTKNTYSYHLNLSKKYVTLSL